MTRDQFVEFLEKSAAAAPGVMSDVRGTQDETVPALLQPQEGPGKGSRGEDETFSLSAEKRHDENRARQLEGYFTKFREGARQQGQQLRGLLRNYGPKAVVSKAQPEEAQG